MIFTETRLQGAYIIDPDRFEDERGFFARTWCQREFELHGLNPKLVQCSLSYSKREGTVRGMHYQGEPHQETKLVRCTRGSIYDVIIDLRPASSTFTHYIGAVLTAENRRMIYIPECFAHGFQTLEDHSEVTYQVSEFYRPEAGRGVRWDDPAFGIAWPLPVTIISDRDRTYPDFLPISTVRNV